VAFKRQLRGSDCVVAWQLQDSAPGIKEHRLEAQIVRDLDDSGVLKKRSGQPLPQRILIGGVFPGAVCQRQIYRRAFGHGEADADDVRLVRIQRRLFLAAKGIVGRGFKVKGHEGCAAEICLDFGKRFYVYIVHNFLLAARDGEAACAALPHRPSITSAVR